METSTPVVLDPAMSPAETGSVSGLAALADKSGAQDGRNPGHLLKSDPTASAGAVAAAVATPVDADPAMSPAESGSISGLAALADKRGAHDSERHHGSSTDAASTAQANKPPTAAAAAATAPQALAEESSDDEDDARRLQFKVIVLGDGTVGKTSLLHRFAFSSFERSYKQTVGVDFFSREVVLPSRHGATHRVSGSSSLLADYSSSSAPSKGLTGPGSSGPTRVDRDTPLASGAASAGSSTTAVLSVWDIGGQNAGSKMLRPYIAGAHAVLLAYDITNAGASRCWRREAVTDLESGSRRPEWLGSTGHVAHHSIIMAADDSESPSSWRAAAADSLSALFYATVTGIVCCCIVTVLDPFAWPC